MHTTCVNGKDNAKSNDSDHIFAIRENTRLKHRRLLPNSPYTIHFGVLAFECNKDLPNLK